MSRLCDEYAFERLGLISEALSFLANEVVDLAEHGR